MMKLRKQGMEKHKEKRNHNFSYTETESLIELILKYKDIIESKKTDATTGQEKVYTWQKITNEFNSTSSSPKSMKILKAKYESIKKELRKTHLRLMEQIKQNDGEYVEFPTLKPYEEKVLAICHINMLSSPNCLDSDNVDQDSECHSEEFDLFNINTTKPYYSYENVQSNKYLEKQDGKEIQNNGYKETVQLPEQSNTSSSKMEDIALQREKNGPPNNRTQKTLKTHNKVRRARLRRSSQTMELEKRILQLQKQVLEHEVTIKQLTIENLKKDLEIKDLKLDGLRRENESSTILKTEL